MLREFDYENSAVIDIVNEIIIDAVKHNASDIHFDPTEKALKVRIRIDGDLIDYTVVPESVKKNMTTRIKIIAGMNITESRLPQDGAIKGDFGGKTLDMRVSSLPIVNGEKVVIRILDYSMSLQGIDTLGFSNYNLEKVKKIISVPNGIILTTGATGSGKSTTNYAILERLNTVEKNIITVEDPVEMKIEGLNQVQVIPEIGMTFANALRSILRQDPDIIMIGEIRDDETAAIAVRASITGHLVLSTLHTNNALNTIERLTDMNVERYLLGSSLAGIISQRLAKRLCPKCRGVRKANEYEKIVIKKALGIDVENLYTPVGCSECFKGYKGRIAVQEILEITPEIRDSITNNDSKEELRKKVYKNGNTLTLLQDGLNKVVNGLTSFEEILRIIDINEDFGTDDEEIKMALLGKLHGTRAQQTITKKTPIINEQLTMQSNLTQNTPFINHPIMQQQAINRTPIEELK